MGAIILVSALSVIFWLFYYQQDLALVIYMTDYVKMSLGSFEIAPSWITTTWNGLLCVALGGIMAAIWKKLAERPQGDMNMFKKVGSGISVCRTGIRCNGIMRIIPWCWCRCIC